MRLIKAHAYGNDFLLLEERLVPAGADRASLARSVCSRHRGIGADGLILYSRSDGERTASMALLNADGSYSEVSGNGVRCLAAWLVDEARAKVGTTVDILTDAGLKRLELLEQQGPARIFRADMGQAEDVRRVTLDVDGEAVDVVTMRVGNPQCVVLGPVTVERLHALAAKLAIHPHFSQGTNVELAEVIAADQVRILIWERGVGPTEASGTGACAAAVAAIRFGAAARDLSVTSPGGAQRVEFVEETLYLTGSAEIIAACTWHGAAARHA